jgi:predicted lipoprotein with Yx(FWY)xxD motif
MMRSHRTKLAGWALASLLLLAGGALAAEPGKATPAPVTVQMTEEGPVFATASGLTLYTSSQEDGAPGKALCKDTRFTEGRDPFSNIVPLPDAAHRKTCLDKWRPLVAAPGAAPAAPWSLVKRDDGASQWAYEGHPLYSSIRDVRPGDVNGSGMGIAAAFGGWRPALAPLDLPPGVKLVRQAEGLVLATADGQMLYVRHGPQRVCDGCAEDLLPLRAAAVAEVHGDWSIIELGNGRRQYAYKGQALYAPPQIMEERVTGSGWAPAVWRRSAGHPEDISTRFSLLGDVFTTKAGMTVYVYFCGGFTGDALSCDDPGDAAAYMAQICGSAEECAQRWRLVRAPAGARQVGEWSVMDVADPLFGDPAGATYLPSQAPHTIKAWAYRGRPLYTFADDEAPGEVLGNGTRTNAGSGFDAITVPGAEVQQ